MIIKKIKKNPENIKGYNTYVYGIAVMSIVQGIS